MTTARSEFSTTTPKDEAPPVQPPSAAKPVPARTRLAETGTAGTTSRPTRSSFVFDPDAEPPLEDPIFDSFVAKGDLVVWIGREKHRKSNLALQCAICAALGRDFLWFRASRPLRVVYVDYESKSRSLWNRYHALCQAMGLASEHMRTLRDNLQIVEVRRILTAGNYFPSLPAPSRSLLTEDEQKASDYWDSFVARFPADLYFIDPMRCFHSSDENDSAIERLLRRVRQVFKDAAVILLHHMRKPEGGGTVLRLPDDMRSWSDGARGSTAIKAHADVVACQERVIEKGNEVVYLGAFMKDGPDVEPTALEETDAQTFLWQPRPDIPAKLRHAVDSLKAAGGTFESKASSVAVVVQKTGVSRATAFRHVSEMAAKGILVDEDGQLVLRVPKPKTPNAPATDDDDLLAPPHPPPAPTRPPRPQPGARGE